jgi:hypothetical protein
MGNGASGLGGGPPGEKKKDDAPKKKKYVGLAKKTRVC